MTTLNLTGQNLEYNNVAPKINKLKNLMLERKVIWDKIPEEKQILWLQHPEKDTIMGLAWMIYKWLHNNFFEDIEIKDV